MGVGNRGEEVLLEGEERATQHGNAGTKDVGEVERFEGMESWTTGDRGEGFTNSLDG